MRMPPTTEPATMPGVLEVGVPGGGVIENDHELSLHTSSVLRAYCVCRIYTIITIAPHRVRCQATMPYCCDKTLTGVRVLTVATRIPHRAITPAVTAASAAILTGWIARRIWRDERAVRIANNNMDTRGPTVLTHAWGVGGGGGDVDTQGVK